MMRREAVNKKNSDKCYKKVKKKKGLESDQQAGEMI